ncbi:hypothetical protein [Labrys sp. 22185]|uniref:hypothetical protein n=1 Tax=Labrys sp. 22185 TaxID=3453888 RepID=UPI003F870CD4
MTVTTIAVLGIDLGKNICSVVDLDGSGAVVMRRKVKCCATNRMRIRDEQDENRQRLWRRRA